MSGVLLAALTASADHIAVSALLPPGYHSEEALTWCGPATGQMVIAGYPSGACVKVQADVDASIQAHKIESVWDTDPDGLRAAMMELCPPAAGGHWVVFSNIDATQLMHSAAFWMSRNQYPVAALLSTSAHNSYAPHQEHWVTVTAIVTDLDPVVNPSVVLKFVQFIDPSPATLGNPPLVRFVSGATWYAQMSTVTKSPSSYTGKFVAVIEPPSIVGHAVPAGRLVLTGAVIPSAEAQRFALEAVEKLRLTDLAAFKGFAGSKPLEPMLVNARRGGYYLVPFSDDGKHASLAVIINAYSGEFQEAGHFAPRAFFQQADALKAARDALRLKGAFKPGEASAELVSSIDEATPYAPEWRITTGKRALTVNHLGRVREDSSKMVP
jgi:hypothetical protein